jgi:hypothetical protein
VKPAFYTLLVEIALVGLVALLMYATVRHIAGVFG